FPITTHAQEPAMPAGAAARRRHNQTWLPAIGTPPAGSPTQSSTEGAIIPAHVGRVHAFSGPDIRRFPQMAIHDLGVVARRKRPGDFENCTNISLRNRYVYFAVDKVANSSIKNALYTIELEPVKRPPPSPFDKRLSPLLSPFQLPPDLLDEVLNSGRYFRF